MGVYAGSNKANKESRRLEAEHRQSQRDNRTDQEQLGCLMDAGYGHCREAQRLAVRIAEAQNA